MSNTSAKIVIIGAGQAGAQTAVSLRQSGHEGQIILIGDETAPPYQRPPLSKGYLKGDLERARLYLKDEAYFSENNVDLRLNTTAAAIDVASKTVSLKSGETENWDALVFATGARPRPLPVPGADLTGVLELRTLNDVDQLKTFATTGKRGVIVGAGYIGLEAAAVLRAMGANVTVLEAAPQVLGRVAGPEIGDFYTQMHRDEGVDLRISAQLKSFEGEGGTITAAVMADGTSIACDFALVGIGVLPNLELARDAGISCENGILVDESMKTSAPDVYAIGDVAWRPLVHYQREGRLESVHNAIEGGKIVAAAILGKPMPKLDVPWFWSDQYDTKLQTAGLWTGADTHILRGNPAERKFSVFYLKEGKVLAVDAVNSAPEFLVGKRLVAAAASVASEDLRDTSISMKDIGAKAPS